MRVTSRRGIHATLSARQFALIAIPALLTSCSSASPEPSPALDVLASGFPECVEPGPPGFEDGASDAALSFVHRLTPEDTSSGGEFMEPFRGAFGAGVVAADLDGDEQIDLFFPQEDGLNGLYWGLGNARFEEAASDHPLRIGDAEAAQLYANTVDYDGDGMLDLLVTGTSSIQLWHNEGGRTFSEQASQSGLQPPARYPGGASWGDYDGDGDLDLFSGNYGEPETGPDSNQNGPAVVASRLWRNDGVQGFSDQSTTLPWQAGQEGACLQGAFRDLDEDGDLDLMQVNDFGPWKGMTMLWENLGSDANGAWQWQDRLPDSGIGSLEFPMGSSFADFDGDGLLDLWLSDIGKNRVLRGLGAWQWVDVGEAWLGGVEDQNSDVSWSVVDLDVDGDMRRDVFISFGPYQPQPPEDPDEPWAPAQPDRLLQAQPSADGSTSFTLLEDAFPMPLTGNARGVAIADLDGNGVADLIVGNIDSAPSILLGRCTASNRLSIQLRQPDSANVFAIGAKVEVEVGGKVQRAELSAGGRGSFSGSHPTLYFSVGQESVVDRIRVTWPDGQFNEARSLCGHCALILTRPR